MKLNINQSTMLRVIASAGTLEDGKQLPWYPRSECYVEDRLLSFDAQRVSKTITFLCKNGLIAMYPKLGAYSCIITSLGRKLAEQEKGKPLTFISVFDHVVLASKQVKQLTVEAENDRAEFERLDGCSCFISSPCGYCTHPGNPLNQEEDESCWETV